MVRAGSLQGIFRLANGMTITQLDNYHGIIAVAFQDGGSFSS
jgi:hypothetical protein